jgi:tetratricopeptide (TPR) repeat protein
MRNMTPDSPFLLLLSRYRQLPPLAREAWEGSLVRLPMWVEHAPDKSVFRPWGVVWVSLSTGRVKMTIEPAPGMHGPELALESLVEFAQQEKKVLGGRAGRILVADAAVRDYLQQAIGDSGVSIELVSRLDAVDDVVRHYREHVAPEDPPAALEGRGVTVDVLRSFADAAAVFYRAAPWRYLGDEDIIRIDAPKPPPGHAFAVVLGNAGHTFGLGFHASRAAHEAMRMMPAAGGGIDARSVIFDSGDEIPLADHDAWEQNDLPLAGPRAYPFAAHYVARGEATRPSREELVFLEGLMRALADTTEAEMDSGAWSKEVAAGGARFTFKLTLPNLLEPGKPGARVGPESSRRASERMQAEIGRFFASKDFGSLEEANAALVERFADRPIDEMESTASTPLERAQDLASQAYDWTGRKRVLLARQALAISPDCAEAYVLLAEHAHTPELAIGLYELAVAAGRRAIGESFDGLVGEFWGHLGTRPYMRARLELAETLERVGRIEEAVGHYKDLLRLNPGDNQGVRYMLVPRLLLEGRDAEAAEVVAAYPEDIGAELTYSAALLAFRTSGDSPDSRDALARAMTMNRFVPKRLLAPDDEQAQWIEHFVLGSDDEAMVCAAETGAVWRATPGALDWLRARMKAGRAERKNKAKPARRRGRPGRR